LEFIFRLLLVIAGDKSYETATTAKTSNKTAVVATTIPAEKVKEIKTLPINHKSPLYESGDEKASNSIPDFKKLSTNFSSFIEDFLQEKNSMNETKKPLLKSSTLSLPMSTPKSIINDDDFIMKHLQASSTSSLIKNSLNEKTTSESSVMEIFAKPSTNPTFNSLLKLSGCNVVGEMYDVGDVIPELSNRCLQCKCLPDVGVMCMPLKC
jgi:hypothetical protein